VAHKTVYCLMNIFLCLLVKWFWTKRRGAFAATYASYISLVYLPPTMYLTMSPVSILVCLFMTLSLSNYFYASFISCKVKL